MSLNKFQKGYVFTTFNTTVKVITHISNINTKANALTANDIGKRNFEQMFIEQKLCCHTFTL